MRKYLLLAAFIISGIFVSKAQVSCMADFDILKDSIFSTGPYGYIFIDKSAGLNIVSWEWDFGDGVTSTDHFPLYEYSAPGTYNVCLTIKTKNNGVIDCQDTQCMELVVDNVNPETCRASFYYYSYSSGADSTLTYPPASTDTYYFTDNSGGNIINRFWDFGDGTKSEEINPVHTFNAAGTYNVCLTVEGLTGDSSSVCQDSYCITISIGQSSLCNADFYAIPDTINVLSYNFADLSTGNPNRWLWNFGDNSTSGGNNTVHTYKVPGKYRVCLNIFNDSIDCNDMICMDIYAGVQPGDCKAAFYYFSDSLLAVNYNFNFVNISKGNANSFLWNFGDGEISFEEDPSHIFSNPGVYNVCLSIADDNNLGCSDTYCQTIFVGVAPSSCNAFFETVADSGAINPGFFKFTDLSSGGPNKWHWNFGDNTIDSIQNPIHVYAQQGIYYPCLTITNNATNCSDIYCTKIFVGGLNSCHAEFTYQKDQTVVSFPNSAVYYFNDVSEGNIGTWYWDFGDGTVSKEQNPLHIFYPGSYKICLTITEKGDYAAPCHDTYCTILLVDSVTPTPANVCNNYITHRNDPADSLTVHFFGSSYYSEPPVQYLWDFGDGNNSPDQNPTHKYSLEGTYIVSLTTIDAESCSFTSTQTVFVGISNNYGQVSGQIFAGNNNADKCTVVIASWDNSANYFTYLDTTHVDSIGSYIFKRLPFGKYYVFAMLTSGSNYFYESLPTFYGDKWNWINATLIDVNEFLPPNQKDINLIPYNNLTTGPGSIGGFVSYGGVKPLKKNPDLSGIEVILFDLDDKPLALTYTDTKGYFKFPKLAYGTYKVYVEIFGIYSTAALVTISPDNENIDNIGFNVDSHILPFVINASTNDLTGKDDFEVSNIFPNPLTNEANLIINNSENTKISIYIFNEIGQVVYQSSKSKQSGKNLIKLNTSNLRQGIYNVMINFGGKKAVTRRFIKN